MRAASRHAGVIERRRFPPWLGTLLRAGTAGYPAAVRRRLELTNAFAYLVVVTALAFGLTYAAIDYQRYRAVVAVNLLHILLGLLVPLGHRLNDLAGGLVLAVALNGTVFLLAWQMGRDSGIQLDYLAGAAIPFLIFGIHHLWVALGVAIMSHALHILAWAAFPPSNAQTPPSEYVVGYTYVAAATATFVFIAVVVVYAFRLADRAERRADALLRNVLPDAIVEQLSEEPDATIADRYEEATVLFADMVGFTPLAQRLGPEGIVRLLNEAFTEFDALATATGVEKIKTIGDSYMVVAGLPRPVDDHCQRVVQMGIGMLELVRRLSARLDIDLQLRVGIATGPVTAGIIGSARFAYDVWGDTVNLAARLESSGVPGRIHVSDGVKELIAGSYAIEARGLVDLKGIGSTQTWFLGAPLTVDRLHPD